MIRLLFILVVIFPFSTEAQLVEGRQINTADAVARCERVVSAYCDAVAGLQASNGYHYVTLTNGEVFVCDDHVNYDLNLREQYQAQLNNPDLADILYLIYPDNSEDLPITQRNWSAGRTRSEGLMKAVYGQDEASIRAGTVTINFLGREVTFSNRNGAAAALVAVNTELLNTIPNIQNTFWSVRDFSGTCSFRTVAGTTRLSSHYFCNAVDFILKDWSLPQYWKWDAICRDDHECLADLAREIEDNLQVDVQPEIDTFAIPGEQFPLQVVSIFEKHGFIWGGRWYHYDSMHFEFRPEFSAIPQACPHHW